ncbi:putative kinase-like protein TMKL1 [Silene latifolia]|uniref:putative kinase-like protein TMKL1 n=1 Tax=Silene latifolia TaxID=37657 RepID=UPI003D775E11
MHNYLLLKLLLCLLIPTFIIIISIFFIYLYRKTSTSTETSATATVTASENPETGNIKNNEKEEEEEPELMCFSGGEDLKVSDILDAPGEVIGKSSYGTLYKANLTRKNSTLLLRFLRPACSGSLGDVINVVHSTGFIRHEHLVPLLAFYVGPRGEKLLVYPFYHHLNLSQFIKDGNIESHKWDTIYKIALGLVKGLAYLHSGLVKPVIHGNLKSKNILLGPNFQPFISDYSLHLLLNPNAGQEMLENSAFQGYKAPELMKIKDARESTDIYSLGIILLELLTGREPINLNASDPQEMHLPNAIRKAILDHRIKDLYHPGLVLNLTGNQRYRIEDSALKLVQIAISCCSPSPSLRPLAHEVVRKFVDLNNE